MQRGCVTSDQSYCMDPLQQGAGYDLRTFLLSRKTSISNIYPVRFPSLRSMPNYDNGNIQRSAVYTLARATCFSNFSQAAMSTNLADLLEIMENWNAWYDVSALSNHQTIKNYLLTMELVT